MVEGINRIGGNREEMRAQIQQKLSSLGIPDEIIMQGPEAVKEYASANNISLPPPPQQAQQGIFAEANVGFKPKDDMKAQIAEKLAALGIPHDIIQQGKTAVEKYAEENNITLPYMGGIA